MENIKVTNVNGFLLNNELFYLKEKYLYTQKRKIFINQDGVSIIKYVGNIFIEFFSPEDGFERTMILSMDKLDNEPAISAFLQRGKILNNGDTVFISYDKEYNTCINIINLNLLYKINWSIKDIFLKFELIDYKHIVLVTHVTHKGVYTALGKVLSNKSSGRCPVRKGTFKLSPTQSPAGTTLY